MSDGARPTVNRIDVRVRGEKIELRTLNSTCLNSRLIDITACNAMIIFQSYLCCNCTYTTQIVPIDGTIIIIIQLRLDIDACVRLPSDSDVTFSRRCKHVVRVISSDKTLTVHYFYCLLRNNFVYYQTILIRQKNITTILAKTQMYINICTTTLCTFSYYEKKMLYATAKSILFIKIIYILVIVVRKYFVNFPSGFLLVFHRNREITMECTRIMRAMY